jgi:pyruvate,orthophosphate dikinase
MPKLVYSFGNGMAEGSIRMKRILGGKGAGLHEMTSLGIPVPPGFTISAEVCAANGKEPPGLRDEVEQALGRLEDLMERRFGDPRRPLLVSVRSGAEASMPGMMDTILNLGLNPSTLEALISLTGNRRFGLDAYRRFIQMFGSIVSQVPRERFEEALVEAKFRHGATSDTELGADDLAGLIERYREIYRGATGEEFPADPREQLWRAIGAVIRSWNNERARTYRRLYRLEGLLGTAVNIQAMVFGNKGEGSATGVAFTRDPSTGENRFYGEYLRNAQGEDVVAGIRTPRPIADLEGEMHEVYRELEEVKTRLEKHFGDVQDFEFTIEEGKLYLLQTRNGKRTGTAAVRIATDLVDEGVIDEQTALMRVEPAHLEQLLFPIFDPKAKRAALAAGRLLAKGLNAGPGAASGKIVFNSKEAETRAKAGEKVILVRHETSPEDIGGMAAAQGILTSTGGMTSHAAVVGRGMGKCCVVGCGAVRVDYEHRRIHVGKRSFPELTAISLDGSTGEVIEGALESAPSEVVQVLVKQTLPAEESEVYRRYARFLSWADKARRLRVRANVDTPEAARNAVALGAEGIGLARTERMFFMPERVTPMRIWILADSDEARRDALARLEPLQREDFAGLFRVMGGRPVTIRLLDPPLHEFLPQEDAQFHELAKALGLADDRPLRAKARAMREQNPMLGRRGCRVGIVFPELYDMQVREILDAACAVAEEGTPVEPEIMVPLVGSARELEVLRERAWKVAEDVFARRHRGIHFLFGTMIEIPRAALTADEVAKHADFFSFGTNDLTQCTFGISRDDGGTFIPEYERKGVYTSDPFAVLDRRGVGKLVKLACEAGRETNPRLELGICGEHGGEPSSVAFCHDTGLDYVSCSAYRVPVARLAAAQAALQAKGARAQLAT